MEHTIIYLHGFASTGEAAKGKLLKKSFNSVITPTLSEHPKEAIEQIKNILNDDKDSNYLIVGSSLGGFYADYFNSLYNVPCILINPLVDPTNIQRFLGENTNTKTNTKFTFTQEDINFLIEMKTEKSPDRKVPELILLAKDDDLLNYKEAIEEYNNAALQLIRTSEDGGHRFTNSDLFIESVGTMLKAIKNITFKNVGNIKFNWSEKEVS